MSWFLSEAPQLQQHVNALALKVSALDQRLQTAALQQDVDALALKVNALDQRLQTAALQQDVDTLALKVSALAVAMDNAGIGVPQPPKLSWWQRHKPRVIGGLVFSYVAFATLGVVAKSVQLQEPCLMNAVVGSAAVAPVVYVWWRRYARGPTACALAGDGGGVPP